MSDAGYAVVVERPGVVACEPQPSDGALPEGRFDVATVFSGLSAGTDLSWVKGTNPALHRHWDPDLGLFLAGEPNAGYPVKRFGYMQVGRVVESRVPSLAAGQLVAMTYGHRSRYRADALRDRFVVLPDGFDAVLGIYVAHMGPICANGLLHAAADVVGADVRTLGDGVRGRRIAVVGAGVVGLLTALLAAHHGAADVVVLDETAGRRHIAERLGVTALDPADGDPALSVKQRWGRAGERGADVVFQCRGRGSALALALRLLRPQGTVIDLAFYQDGCGDVRLGEEFHHNGLSVRCAQIGRVPRGTGHLWNRDRLSAETVAFLQVRGDDVRAHLITDYVPLAEAPQTLSRLATTRHHGLQLVFSC
ncbi:zinc-binding alcohol dehydrogenase [Mycobacterium sp. IS-1496]|uniref:zinc-dependent alcohol dehydrogenase n=1 Tax=Mycobacterium sp. IS-1496 TaxID=1772284 RepID=UPI00074177CF|nr:zinc-binding alcohol dehydrogenase [Mycobacterium sp. IS-1496]KUI35642.1 zinc-binding alcohol dehydrogenase [Mycobacterium sp. IS-1496]